MITIRVSGASLRQHFDGCQPDFVKNVCHGMCCCPTKGPAMPLIVIARIGAGTLQREEGVDDINITRDHLCTYFSDDYRCGLHGQPNKPFGCVVAPFQLTKHNLLGVRNRYRRFPCFNGGAMLPAYEAFRTSLVTLFGVEEADRVTALAAGGAGIFEAQLREEVYDTIYRVQDIESAPWAKAPVEHFVEPTFHWE